MLGRILFNSVVMVLAFGARGHCFESCPDLIFLPCIYSFVSLIRNLFVRCRNDCHPSLERILTEPEIEPVTPVLNSCILPSELRGSAATRTAKTVDPKARQHCVKRVILINEINDTDKPQTNDIVIENLDISIFCVRPSLERQRYLTKPCIFKLHLQNLQLSSCTYVF